jgi:hypothetical protein
LSFGAVVDITHKFRFIQALNQAVAKIAKLLYSYLHEQSANKLKYRYCTSKGFDVERRIS